VKRRRGNGYQAKFGVRSRNRRGRRRIQRCMKCQDAECAETIVSDDLGLRIELPGGITLMEMGESEKLGGENQDGAEERNRLCAPSNRRCRFSPPRNHR
jgi:hypothetical protein